MAIENKGDSSVATLPQNDSFEFFSRLLSGFLLAINFTQSRRDKKLGSVTMPATLFKKTINFPHIRISRSYVIPLDAQRWDFHLNRGKSYGLVLIRNVLHFGGFGDGFSVLNHSPDMKFQGFLCLLNNIFQISVCGHTPREIRKADTIAAVFILMNDTKIYNTNHFLYS